MFCLFGKKNLAQRRYLQGGLGVLITYFGFFFSTITAVHRFHPHGWRLYLAAALPSFPILGFIFVVARYLREETDGFERDMLVRCMLWGTAVVMAVNMFSGFLRIYGWSAQLPPFTEYFAFCITVLVAKFTYRFSNRVPADA